MTQKQFLEKYGLTIHKKTGEVIDRRDELLSDLTVMGVKMSDDRGKSVENKKWVVFIEKMIKEFHAEIDKHDEKETDADDARIVALTEIVGVLEKVIDNNRGPRFKDKARNIFS